MRRGLLPLLSARPPMRPVCAAYCKGGVYGERGWWLHVTRGACRGFGYTPGEVRFGSDDDTRNLLLSTEVDDLVVDNLNHVEGGFVGDRVDEDEAVYANCML